MKVLSVKQPWAWLIVAGVKNVENRTWFTNYDGPLLIHAGKTWDHEGAERIRQEFPRAWQLIDKHFGVVSGMRGTTYPPVCRHTGEFGAIVGQVELMDCTEPTFLHASKWAEPELWHWNLRNAKTFNQPIPCKGHQGLWEVEL